MGSDAERIAPHIDTYTVLKGCIKLAEGIPGPPNQYPAGLDFDYSIWTAGTIVELVNVNWNNDYRDTVKFASKQALKDYITQRATFGIKVDRMTYVKPNEDVTLGMPYNQVNRFNYIRVSNPLTPIPGDIQKDYYYFILDSEYINPTVTRLRLQLDVWQTYVYDIELLSCYVERSHAGIANENAFINYGRDYLTVPEGIDLGNEYMTVATRNKWIMSLTPVPINDRYPGHDVLVIAATDLGSDGGTSDDPDLNSADGTTFQATTQGAGIWVFDPQQFNSFMNEMKDKPWITQGITSITVIPRINRYHPDFNYSELVTLGAKGTTLYAKTLTYNLFENWRDSDDYVGYIPDRYRHLLKLKTYPYTAIELTTFGATPIILKPEAWNSAHARLFERASLLPPAQRIEFSPRFYNSRNKFESDLEDLYPAPITGYEGMKGDDEGDYVDLVTQIANFPTMSIVNNGQLNYLASNAHGLAFQRRSADWSETRALSGANGAYNVAAGAMGAAKDLTAIANMVDLGQTANTNQSIAEQFTAQTIGNLISSAGGGAVFGPVGAAAGAASALGRTIGDGMSTGAQMAANDRAASLRNNSRNANVGIENKQAQLQNDTNLNIAKLSAYGDYANIIAGINAKVQDAELIQPSVSGQIGGEAMNMINGGWQVALRFKMIDQARMRIIGEYWLRYGYAIRAFMKPPASLMTMTKFTYWKMTETYIASDNVPEGFKQVLRGIFEKGVTVHANPDEIGRVDMADNEPLEGFSY